METEWKQMLQDSGITEDLQLDMENGSGLKGKWSKIFRTFNKKKLQSNIFQKLLFSLLVVFDIFFLCPTD